MSLSDPIQLSQFIEEIYDCVLDQTRWERTLQSFCARIDGCAALFADTPSVLIQYGSTPDYWSTYVEKYSRDNPWFDAALMNCPEGGVSAFYEVADIPAFQQSSFYRDWLQPQGWGDCIVAMLERTTPGFAMLSAVRMATQAPFGEEELVFLQAVLPHAQKAARLGRLFNTQNDRISGMTNIIDRVSSAAFLVDRAGRMKFSNRMGDAVLADGSILREAGGFLIPNEESMRATLRADLTATKRQPTFKTLRHASGDKIVAIIPPAETGGEDFIVLLFAADNAPAVPAALLTETYGMTAAEIRVLVGLVKGQKVGDIAKDLGITARTVRAHLEKLFSKTQSRGQTELLRKTLTLTPAMQLFSGN